MRYALLSALVLCVGSSVAQEKVTIYNAPGVVAKVNVSGGQGSVDIKAGKFVYTFKVGKNTKVVINEKPARLDDLRPGNRVQISYTAASVLLRIRVTGEVPADETAKAKRIKEIEAQLAKLRPQVAELEQELAELKSKDTKVATEKEKELPQLWVTKIKTGESYDTDAQGNTWAKIIQVVDDDNMLLGIDNGQGNPGGDPR
jgi:hypothetical protein